MDMPNIKKSHTHKIIIPHKLDIEKCFYLYDCLEHKYGLINFNDVKDKVIIKCNKNDNKTSLESLNQIYKMAFVDDIFVKYYENYCDKCVIIKINNHTINITYEDKLFTESQIDNYVSHIINVIRMFDKEFEHTKIFNFILSPFIKTYDKKSLKKWQDKYPYLIKHDKLINDDVMGPFHINTGVSFGYDMVYLYRADELFKVLFHECIHNFALDINVHNPTCEHGQKSKYEFCDRIFMGKNEYPLLINEAYTEYLALLMLNYYLCQLNYYKHNNPHNITTPKYLYSHMLQRELENSAYQCSKFFKFYNINNIEILLTHNDLKQNTNALSYIFLKYIILINMIDIKGNVIKKVSELMKIEFTKHNINNYNYIINLVNMNLEDDMHMQLSAYKILI